MVVTGMWYLKFKIPKFLKLFFNFSEVAFGDNEEPKECIFHKKSSEHKVQTQTQFKSIANNTAGDIR